MVIYDAPDVLRGSQTSVMPYDTLAENRSIYTGAAPIPRLDFGGGWWAMTIATPSMYWEDMAKLFVWTRKLRKPDAVARLSPPARANRIGTTALNAIAISDPTTALSNTVEVTGLESGAILDVGSFLTIGDSLYMAQNSVEGPFGTLEVWPRLRKPVLAGDTVKIGNNVSGIWTLTKNITLDFSARQDSNKLQGVVLEFIEHIPN